MSQVATINPNVGTANDAPIQKHPKRDLSWDCKEDIEFVGQPVFTGF